MVQHDRLTARILMICPPYPSHRQAFAALAEELRARGHHVRFLDGDRMAVMPCLRGYPDRPGKRETRLQSVIAAGAERTQMLCRLGPKAIGTFRPDLILGDQTEPAAGLLARHLNIPMISIACALPFDHEPGVPFPFLGWAPDHSERGIKRLQLARQIAQWVMYRHSKVILAIARQWGLEPLRDFTDCVSSVMTLSQTVPGFDHLRPVNGAHVQHMGPFRAPTADHFPHDIHRDPTKPLIFVCLGTLQGHRHRLLARIARACRRAGAQVLVSLGGYPIDLSSAIPADWVYSFVPQRAILRQAQVCVTHGGMNTAMECLEYGVPMLALPLTTDQPGVASRIVRSGTGLRLSPLLASENAIHTALRRLMTEPSFRMNTMAFAAQAPHWPRAAGAADAVDTMLHQSSGHGAASIVRLPVATHAVRRL